MIMASAVRIGISHFRTKYFIDDHTSVTRQTTFDPYYVGLNGPKKA